MRPAATEAGAATGRDRRTRPLGDTDLAITPIGFGTWAIGARSTLALDLQEGPA